MATATKSSNSVLVDELYPLVEKALSNPTNVNKIKRAVTDYLDRNMDRLTTPGPVYRTIFSDSDMNKLYEAIEVDPAEIKRIVQGSPTIKSQWKIMNNIFNPTIAMIIRYFTIKKNQEMVNATLVYLTLSMYPSLHFKYFKHEPNEQIMNYTINNLSNKFKIKQTGTVYHALVDTTQVCYRTNTDKLIRGTDKDIVDFIMDEKTRLNSLLKKIANEFYRNSELGKYMNLDSDNLEEENYHEADSNTFAVERLTNNVVLKLVVEGPNMRLVTVAANLCKVSVSELRNYVNTMVVSENREDIRAIVESILFLYIFDSQNTIQEVNSNKFLMYCMETYKKSNTTDKNIIRIKKILDKWLENLGTYKKTQRFATINSFRRALFLFFVLSIQTTY
jgi:hypothetical protein